MLAGKFHAHLVLSELNRIMIAVSEVLFMCNKPWCLDPPFCCRNTACSMSPLFRVAIYFGKNLDRAGDFLIELHNACNIGWQPKSHVPYTVWSSDIMPTTAKSV